MDDYDDEDYDDEDEPIWQPAPVLVFNTSSAARDTRPTVNHVTFSPDGAILATASGDYFCERADLAVRLWDTTTGGLLVAINDLNPEPLRLTFSPNGSEIAGVFGSKLAVWAVRPPLSDAPTLMGSLVSSHTERLRMTITREGESLPTWWLPSELDPYLNPDIPVTEHTNRYAGVPLYFYQPQLLSVAWSPDGHLLAAAGTDGAVHCWAANDGRYLHTLDGHHNTVMAVAWNPDSTRLVSASFDGTARIWDVTSGACLAVLHGHIGPVDRVAWSGDGQVIASTSKDGVRLWHADGTLLHILDAPRSSYGDVVFSPDSRYLASAHHPQEGVQIWDVRQGIRLTRLQVDVTVYTLAWSPDGSLLACGSTHGLVWLWSVADSSDGALG